ncbi:MAG: MFS transporter, partial [Solirubrobacteraceae bacterium]
ALADRVDRRPLLAVAQLGTAVSAGTLAVLSLTSSPPVWVIFVLAALLAGSGALDSLSRSSMIVSLAGDWLRSGIAFAFAVSQLTAIAGPGLGGILIGATSVGWVYAIDAASVVMTVFAVFTIGPQRPVGVRRDESILTSVVEGLRFVRSSNALLGSFVIDLFAMTFGMPRARFVILSVHYFHAGAAGTGLLYASVSLGAAIAGITNAWLTRARWLGRITIAMVVIWGAAIAAAGTATSIVVAAILLGVAGAADSISAVCRTTIAQLISTDATRGRISSVFGLVVTGGVRLGDIESGTVASVTTPRFTVISGGLACIAGVGVVLLAFPRLATFDALDPSPT